MVRRPEQKPQNKYPNANAEIKASEVRLIDEDGTMLGVLSTEDALQKAAAKNLDLVEVSPNAVPPVCKLLNFGKYKYELQKRESDNRKKQKIVKVKEIKLRPTIDDHDYGVKLNSIEKFLKAGDKVKVTLRFRGREITHQDIAVALFNRIVETTEEYAKAELGPKMEGRQMIMILCPR